MKLVTIPPIKNKCNSLFNSKIERKLNIGNIKLKSQYDNLFEYKLSQSVINQTKLMLSKERIPLSDWEYKLLELEMLVYLLASTKYSIPVTHIPLQYMLNSFRLHTTEYMQFCLNYLGEIIHSKPYEPTISESKKLDLYVKLGNKLQDLSNEDAYKVNKLCNDFINRFKECNIVSNIPSIKPHDIICALILTEKTVISTIIKWENANA